eukprot:CAMPEP_0184498750 /NCGR_PEP_ID=MMETSP0113_2-20130426/39731_1 /TAXON_ID=91329 /ORGANISM="Norrisiella sphaerica, Strain BC52" /LENGTH=382 /DNA_ID=CAMNT_0026886395 /DNA_START=309 /DNA_END=1457 /DNA_ORIENTATION=-
MMETNSSFAAQIQAELEDVDDVCRAANVSIAAHLVDCMVNIANDEPLAEEEILNSFFKEFPLPHSRPTLTVVRMGGEISGLNSSLTCTAVTSRDRRTLIGNEKTTLVAASPTNDYEYAWISVNKTSLDELETAGTTLESLLREAGGGGAVDIVDCTAFVTNSSDVEIERLRDWFYKLTGFVPRSNDACENEIPPGVLTLIRENMEHRKANNEKPSKMGHLPSSFKLRCTAVLNSSVAQGKRELREQIKRRKIGANPEKLPDTRKKVAEVDTKDKDSEIRGLVAGDFVFLAGVSAHQRNASDALDRIESALGLSNTSRMDLMVNCLYFGTDIRGVEDYFKGFYAAFNLAFPPPPSRGEFSELSAPFGCKSCSSTVKCIAAIQS